MEKSIIIDVGLVYTRAAIFEDNQLVNIFLDNHDEKQIQGTIYQGRITNIVKNIKAAFVDIGQPKSAFLHYEDTPEKLKGKLQNNQRMMVQVIKEGVGNKGPKATAFINITGKFMVLLPLETTIGVSRKISDESQRKRLKQLIRRNNPKKYGVIIRTGAVGATDDQLEQELKSLISKWETIETKSVAASSGTILHQEPSLPMQVVREHANENIKEIVINDLGEGEKIQEFLSKNIPGLQEKVRMVDPVTNLYGAYNIDQDIEGALRKKIWLKSGANIIIEKTEAMNIIDVNSAKAVKTKQKDKMILKINLQAAKESARQIRLRNLSGIIIIDFIAMDHISHQEQVIESLQEELNKDKIKTQLYPMTQLGLVQMTRQRRHISLQEQIMQHCRYCQSPYVHLNNGYLLVEIEKDIRNFVRESIHKNFEIRGQESLINYLDQSFMIKDKLESKYQVNLKLLKKPHNEKTPYDIKPIYSSLNN